MNPFKKKYDKLLKGFDHQQYLAQSTLSLVHQMQERPSATIADIEICAIWMAILSWGKPEVALEAANNLMNRCEWKPSEFVKLGEFIDIPDMEQIYLTLKGKNFKDVCLKLRYYYINHTSVQNELKINHNTTIEELIEVISYWTQQARLGSPARNSACTRINTLLRWMVRKDDIDLGLWSADYVKPENLYAIMDYGTAHQALQQGLISYSRDSWKAVLELTNVYKDWDPKDPLKYDFVLNPNKT
jgi:uncharacterized protein (TIGR02757 family)